ncbi:MAG: hypothetical protein O7C59_05085 [Rickettsia endosymbiont of Ixodes persulcatus]|nr:hypothetical protein [Rickettsia endosymbiont of Ixodes persulcatus]
MKNSYKKMLILIPTFILFGACSISETDTFNSKVDLKIISNEESEYIIKFEPIGTPQYTQKDMMYRENQEDINKDKDLYLTNEKKN